MGFFDIFGGGPFDFNGDGRTDASELALGFMMLDGLGKAQEKERKKQEFVNELFLNAAMEGLEYTDEEIQEILADSERLGLFD
ncbi:MAG: hypothetical protein HDT37_01920 [Clostridiales bacterium]|nr:hypothetical protein [Clostridiales bacterium]